MFGNLATNYPNLISKMRASGYSDYYITGVEREISFIMSQWEDEGWSSYEDVIRYYESVAVSAGALEKRCTYLRIIVDFCTDGKHPNGKWSMLVRNDAYTKLTPEFQRLVDGYKTISRKRGIKESSIKTISQNSASFLLAMQKSGITRLADISEEAVIGRFVSKDGEPLKSCSNRKFIAAFFRDCTPIDQEGCKKALSFIPIMKGRAKNVQYIKPNEAQAILAVLDDTSNSLSMRDRAIGKLAYYTGMRSCDIVALDLSAIDWRLDIIAVKQQKTERPLDIPLSAVVGNAIYDYLAYERPSVDCPALFITTGRPYKRMHSTSLWCVSVTIMDKAGIRQSKGDRRGLHLFRHKVATSLLGNGVPQAVISEALGHSSPESLETYLSADIIHIRECALSIARFPVGKGVFADA